MSFDILNYDNLWSLIRDTYTSAWENYIDDNDIERWLNNFNGEFLNDINDERKVALWLLSHFSFYTESNIRALCKSVYNDYVHAALEITNCKDILTVINSTTIIPLGKPSESGSYISYLFRQENKLGIESFSFAIKEKYENIVFIDDATFSGNQAITNIKKLLKGNRIDGKNVFFITLFSTKNAQRELQEAYNNFIILSPTLMDERDKVFSNESYVFSDSDYGSIKTSVRDFCKYYGKKIGNKGQNVLGYKNGQYLIGFEHNTPNNTLPIFWSSSYGWKPIFVRHTKTYNNMRYKLDESKYY